MTKTTPKKKPAKKNKPPARNKTRASPDKNLRRQHRFQRENPQPSCLRFTANAWAKLIYLCHRGETEIGGFGITPTDDLLLVEELFLPQQQTTSVTVKFDDESIADFFEDQVAAGRSPEQFGRVWIHTHPGNCPSPSSVDEATFARVFGGCDWAVMFILARGGATYTRLRFNSGPGGEIEIPAEVDFSRAFVGSDHQAWEDEYLDRVHQQQAHVLMPATWGLDESTDPFDWLDDPGLYDEAELLEQGDF